MPTCLRCGVVLETRDFPFCTSCGAKIRREDLRASAVRTYVLVIDTDDHYTYRIAVRAYTAEDAERRFRPTPFTSRDGHNRPTQHLRDVEPYEPERRLDHQNIERRDGLAEPVRE
jgi:hypothetical protein